MDVLIIGKNEIVAGIGEYLEQKGFQKDILEDGRALKKIIGEAGDFEVHTTEGEKRVKYIVLVEDVKRQGETAALPICVETIEKIMLGDFRLPIVFLMDYLEETPESEVIRILTTAIELTEKKRRVVCMLRFNKAFVEDEIGLFKNAKNLGVLFINYNECRMHFDSDSGNFEVTVSDGCFNMAYHTPYVLSPISLKNPIYLSLAEKLGLKTYIDENKEILTGQDGEVLNPVPPILTERKGIFYLNQWEDIPRLIELLQK